MLASLVVAVATAGADGFPRTSSGDAPVPVRPAGATAIVTRDDARREVQAWILPGATAAERIEPAVLATGRLIVRNRSGFSADVYLALAADEPDWQFIGEPLPTGYKLVVRNLARRTDFMIAAEETDNYDNFFDWGPRTFVMRKRYRYTLLP